MATGAYGIEFAYAENGTDFTAVGELVDITPPSITKDVIETTHHGSSGIKSYIGGLVDFGEVSITVNYSHDTTSQTAIRTLAATANDEAGDKRFKITYSDANTETFAGIVTGFSQESPIDDRLTATFAIKVTGTITVA